MGNLGPKECPKENIIIIIDQSLVLLCQVNVRDVSSFYSINVTFIEIYESMSDFREVRLNSSSNSSSVKYWK